MKVRTYVIRRTVTWEVIELLPPGREQIAIAGLKTESEALEELKKLTAEEPGDKTEHDRQDERERLSS